MRRQAGQGALVRAASAAAARNVVCASVVLSRCLSQQKRVPCNNASIQKPEEQLSAAETSHRIKHWTPRAFTHQQHHEEVSEVNHHVDIKIRLKRMRKTRAVTGRPAAAAEYSVALTILAKSKSLGLRCFQKAEQVGSSALWVRQVEGRTIL
jgi:hypothetical protein